MRTGMIRVQALGMLVALLLGAGLAAQSTPARAADLEEPAAPLVPEEFDKRWKFAGAVYLWAAGIDGTMAGDGLGPAKVHATFGDILSDLNGAIMATGEVRYERFGLYTDVVYTSIEASGSGPAGLLRLKATNDSAVATAMGVYRALEVDNSSLDVMAGARLWYVDTELELKGPRRVLAKREISETWVDPMIGMRARLQGDTPFYVMTQALIGGFGAASSIDGDLIGIFGYEVNKHVSLVAGYRAYGVDYKSGDFEYDVIQHGPVIAGVINF